ncbi:cobalt-precorrin-5B (C(1))-methyltransferase CbiD [Natroniella acetigena]|uniref:cobalt-precorrin-5B (C(1))-methyltransferase CbiD n=1 Tax=Natroniella acetigena TaxID=52004 RepID=UPI00200B549B|nr:cobalt-precorrin-5B (C(1))-methyltransferase CbiD [Natroniella acetigena]MCK8826469.1 cobalt-precorrin-5B (C(1))-methyltransferase CbiD [Natroniella acetigena]
MGFESYIIRDGEKLKRGYTTGSAAVAAAKAATKMLMTEQEVKTIKIDTPAEIELELEVVKTSYNDQQATASIIKDGGDDPDVTDGLEIVAHVELLDSPKIELDGGQGVGQVTKPGLATEVGEVAINPVPRKMIIDEVKKVLPAERGAKIVIEVPKGEETATKTLNPQLGIEGGISILGTTGIVEPISEQAYKDSLVLAIDQALATGEEELVFVFGNYGKRMAAKLGYQPEQVIRMSNFVGFMLKYAVEKGVSELTLIGHLGKLVKVAAGIFNTHSYVADARRETIAAYTAASGGQQELIKQILAANTAEETIELLKEAELTEVFDLLAKRVAIRAEEYVKGELEVRSLLFSMEEEVLGSYKIDN